MGYACPVCEDPQADGDHLANHLAFTAMLGDPEHEAWLDEHAPDWADADPGELASIATEHAPKTEYPQVFEDTTDDGDDGAHDHDHGGHRSPDPAPDDVLEGATPAEVPDPSTLLDDADDRDVSDVLAEARELTRQRRSNAESDASEDGDE